MSFRVECGIIFLDVYEERYAQQFIGVTTMDYEELIKEIKNTSDSNRRNEIALELMDMKYDSAVPVLIELIKKLSNTNNYATLIYALQGLNCSEYICDKTLLNIIFYGNFEASNCMLEVLKKEYNNLSSDSNEKIQKIFADEKERAEDIIEMIDDIYDNFFEV